MVRAQTTITRDADFMKEFMLKLFHICHLVVVYPKQFVQPLRTFLWGMGGQGAVLGVKSKALPILDKCSEPYPHPQPYIFEFYNVGHDNVPPYSAVMTLRSLDITSHIVNP